MTSDWRETSAERIAERLTLRIDRLQRRGLAANIVHLKLGADRGPSVAAAERLVARYKPTHRFVMLEAWG